MAYIPPHKRNSNEAHSPVLTPDKLAPSFKRNVNARSSTSNNKWGSMIFYADHAVSKWWAVGLNDDARFPSSINLEPVSTEAIWHRNGEKPLALRNSVLVDGNEVQWDLPKSPWVCVVENVLEDLLESFEMVKKEMMSPNIECIKPTLVARVGKVFFHRSPSVTPDILGETLTVEMLKSWKRSFYTTVPVLYTDKIVNEVVPNVGVVFDSEKDIYQVKLADSTKPGSILSCKCSVKDGKLQLYKVELNQLRGLVVDMSVANKNLDLRLMLKLKRDFTIPSYDDRQSIMDLVDSAVTDPDVKGGLRWPLEKTTSGKYTVVRVWHVSAKSYKNQSLRFKVRHTDRFDFRTLSGDASWETSLRLKKVESLLMEKADVSLVSEMLKENMKFIWDNFLTCASFLA